MIRGYFNSGRPSVLGLTYFVDLQQLRPVQFLIDTGADTTTIHPGDFLPLDVDPALLLRKPDSQASGIGGQAQAWKHAALVMLLEDDLETVKVVSCNLDVAVPHQLNMSYPSLLGRDVLQHFVLTIDGNQSIRFEALDYVLTAQLPNFLRR